MASIDISRVHTLGLDGARRAANDVAARLRRDFGVETRWDGDSVHVEGRGITGRLETTPDTIRVTARLGLAARPFRRALTREIERELARELGTL